MKEVDIPYPYHVWTGDVSWFWNYMYYKHKDNKFNFTHDHNGSYWYKLHEFLYLNKAERPHRTKLYDKLLKENLLENSIYTFVNRNPSRRLPKKYELPGIEPEHYPRWGKDQDITGLPYVDTVCSIVSETNDNDYEVFMTEKIWKPIMAQHVFVVHGNYLYLQQLREMGFKTFDQFWDESYDDEESDHVRITKITEVVRDICHRSNEELLTQYNDMLPILRHNYSILKNYEQWNQLN